MRQQTLTPAARRRRWLLAGTLAATVAAAAWPVPAALTVEDHWLARVLIAVVTGVATSLAGVLLVATSSRIRRRVAVTVAAVAVVAGATTALLAAGAQRRCTAQYAHDPVVIGTTLTPQAERYLAANPTLTADDLVLDAAGVVERVWTRESIATCRLTILMSHAAWWPLLAIALVGVATAATAGSTLFVAASPDRPHTPRAPAPAARPPARYDAFISYKHEGVDEEHARRLVEALESEGYAVAIDARDFAPNAAFLTEMERCIRESRFTLALVSSRYLASGPCEEESLICRVLDFGERQRRLIPIYIERVDAPAWLHTLTGLDLFRPDPLVDPMVRLTTTLGTPLSGRGDPPVRVRGPQAAGHRRGGHPPAQGPGGFADRRAQ